MRRAAIRVPQKRAHPRATIKTTVGKDPELKSGGSDCTSLWGNAETVT